MNDGHSIIRRALRLSLACMAALAVGCAGAGTGTARSGNDASAPTRLPRLAPIAAPRTSIYDCEKDLRFTAYFHADTAELALADGTVTLVASMTPAGTRYINRDISLWINGDSTFLRLGGVLYRNCLATETIEGAR